MSKKRVAIVAVLFFLSLPVAGRSHESGEPTVKEPNPIIRVIRKAIRSFSDQITVPKP